MWYCDLLFTVYCEQSAYVRLVHHFVVVHLFVIRFLVRVSYLEIYNEEVRDLLSKDQQHRLEVR